MHCRRLEERLLLSPVEVVILLIDDGIAMLVDTHGLRRTCFLCLHLGLAAIGLDAIGLGAFDPP